MADTASPSPLTIVLLASLALLAVTLLACATGRAKHGVATRSDPDAGALSATDRARAERTMEEMGIVGTALMSWVTDRIGTSDHLDPAGPQTGFSVQPDLGSAVDYLHASHATLTRLLVPTYLPSVPAVDGWGSPYEFAINPDLMRRSLFAIRSAGADQVFDTDRYTVGTYSTDALDSDIVWADGFFVRRPDPRND